MEPKEERSYLLFVWGNYKGADLFIKQLAEQFSPVLSSNVMKYSYGDHGIVCHFDSDSDFDDLQMFVHDAMSMVCEQYFFMEKPERMSVHGPQEVLEHLFINDENLDGLVINVDNSSKDDGGSELESIIEFFKSINPEDLVEDEEQDSELFKILEKKKKKEKPDIDKILDKIVDKGMSSLTKKEKKILDNYDDGK